MWSGIWSIATTRVGFRTWIWSNIYCGLEQEMACWFLQKLNWIFLIGLITLVLIDVKIGGSFVEEKSSFKILALFFSSKLNWDSKIISIVKPASKNIGTLIHSMKFLFPEVALYLYKSTIQPCIENCCHVWAGAPNCYLEWSFTCSFSRTLCSMSKFSQLKSFL